MTMRNGLVDQADKFKKRIASADTSPYKVVERGQLVVGFPIDEAVLAFQSKYDAAIVSPAYAVWSLAGREVDRTFLERFLRSPQAIEYYKSRLRGSTARRRSLPVTTFLELPVWLPPLPEQRRIATILDQADDLRSKGRHALTLLDELADSIFIEMFGGAVERGEISNLRLDELTDADDRINYGVVQPGDGVAEGVPLIRVGDMRFGGVNDANLKRISTEIEKSYVRSRIRGTEILVSCVGSIGEVSIVRANHIGHNVARAVARVPLSSPEHRTYVAAALRSSTVQAYFVNEARTVSQPTLNIKQLAATPIPWPMKTDLATFHRRVSELEAVQNANREQAAQLDELFSSLQHRAFRGEL